MKLIGRTYRGKIMNKTFEKALMLNPNLVTRMTITAELIAGIHCCRADGTAYAKTGFI